MPVASRSSTCGAASALAVSPMTGPTPQMSRSSFEMVVIYQ
jgi:uncharacterized membrane protein YadS